MIAVCVSVSISAIVDTPLLARSSVLSAGSEFSDDKELAKQTPHLSLQIFSIINSNLTLPLLLSTHSLNLQHVPLTRDVLTLLSVLTPQPPVSTQPSPSQFPAV